MSFVPFAVYVCEIQSYACGCFNGEKTVADLAGTLGKEHGASGKCIGIVFFEGAEDAYDKAQTVTKAVRAALSQN